MEKFGFCLFAPTECTKNICNGRDKRLTYFWVYYNFLCVWGGGPSVEQLKGNLLKRHRCLHGVVGLIDGEKVAGDQRFASVDVPHLEDFPKNQQKLVLKCK